MQAHASACTVGTMKAWILAIALVLWATLPGARSLPREKWSDTAEVKWSALNRILMNTEQTAIQSAGIFKGCYSDTEGQILGKTGWTSESDQNINADCKESCIKKGYAVASTKGRYCYCTDSLPLPQLYHPNNKYAAGNEGPCNLTCPGAFTKEKCVRDECCGGENAYTVYTVGQWPDIDQLHMKADEEGYTMIQNLQDTQDIKYSEGETQNSKPLASIQSIGTFDGCYSDRNASILGNRGIALTLSNNYNVLCQQKCKESGYAIASTKGSKCYCTNLFPLPLLYRADDERSAGKKGPCNVVCPGSYASRTSVDCMGDECCGGIGSAYSVYIVGQIDALKQLQRRIINRVMNRSQAIELFRGAEFHIRDDIVFEEWDVHPLDDCQYGISKATTVGARPSSLKYEVDFRSNQYGMSLYVLSVTGRMDTECTFQRMKLEFFATFTATSDDTITVVLSTQGKQFTKSYYLRGITIEQAQWQGTSGYSYSVDIQLPNSTRVSDISIDFSSKHRYLAEAICEKAYPVLALIEVWGTGCTLELPEKYGVSVIARGRTATNTGIGGYVTYNLTSIDQVEDLKIVSNSSVIAERLDMRLVSMNKLVEREGSGTPHAFLRSDVVCDHTYSGHGLCKRSFTETFSIQNTFTTQQGLNLAVKIGVETEAGVLFAKAKTTFEASIGYSFTFGRSKSHTSSKTETFAFNVNTPAGYKTEITFFKSFEPVHMKWRAVFSADGFVLVYIVNADTKKEVFDKPFKLHLSQLLTYKERELYAFGIYDFGERPTISATAKTVDRNGNIISVQPMQPSG